MAVDDLSTLRKHLPEIFSDFQVQENWDDEWFIVPIDDPEQGCLDQQGICPELGMEAEMFDQAWPDPLKRELDLLEVYDVPDFGTFPGGPFKGSAGDFYPPPDAFAFYLPFHYFYPTWWGIYPNVGSMPSEVWIPEAQVKLPGMSWRAQRHCAKIKRFPPVSVSIPVLRAN